MSLKSVTLIDDRIKVNRNMLNPVKSISQQVTVNKDPPFIIVNCNLTCKIVHNKDNPDFPFKKIGICLCYIDVRYF